MSQAKKILIIDDEREFCVLIYDYLRPRGYEVAFATNPDAGIETARDLGPDLILLDIMMPGKNGFEVLKGLKANPKTASIPVVMLTALDDDGSRRNSAENFSEDYITKPVSCEALMAKIEAVLKRRGHIEKM